MPTITQLQYILSLHRHGHFGEAARSCNVSQPTLSMQIKKVEEQLGCTIFDRRGSPIVATEKGLLLIAQSQKVLAAHEQLLGFARGQFEVLSGTLSLGIIPTLAPYVTHWFLSVFAKRYPGIHLSIVELPTEDIVRDLRKMRLDVGLLATPLEIPSMRERVLFYDPLYLYAGADEALLKQSDIDAEDLDPARLWLLADGHCMRNQALEVCELSASRAPQENLLFEAGSLETLRHIIDSSGGYTIVPETFARLLPRPSRVGQVRPFRDPVPTREVSLLHLKRTWKVDLIDALQGTIVEQLPRALRKAPEVHKTISVGV